MVSRTVKRNDGNIIGQALVITYCVSIFHKLTSKHKIICNRIDNRVEGLADGLNPEKVHQSAQWHYYKARRLWQMRLVSLVSLTFCVLVS